MLMKLELGAKAAPYDRHPDLFRGTQRGRAPYRFRGEVLAEQSGASGGEQHFASGLHADSFLSGSLLENRYQKMNFTAS
jgi:hypothetical protein